MLRLIFKILLKFQLINIIAFFYFLNTKNLFQKSYNKKTRILALSSTRFMEVLEIIQKNSDFQILTLPYSWQSRFLNFFYTSENRKDIGLKTMDKKIQSKFYRFLRLFLYSYYRLTKIDLVLGPAIHYKQDIDWGAVSKSIGVPYIVIHKENLYASEGHIATVTKKLKLRQRFQGSHVIVHNDIVKNIWVKSKFIKEKEISACGKLTNNTKSKSLKNSIFDVVFFSFGPGVGVAVDGNIMFPKKEQIGYHNLCRITHLEVINFAIRNPKNKVIIKPKWGGDWIDYIYKLAREENIKLDEIKNLVINENLNSFSIIENCSVVISFNSTTVLEAGIKNKYVIIPYFEEAKKNLKKFVHFKNYFNLFEIADSGKDIHKKITLGLENPKKYNKVLHERKKLYELYVSSLTDNQVKKYIQVIEKNKTLAKIKV